jgi:predicted helicase
MANFTTVRNHLFSLSPEARGKTFEHYCKWFLENDPRYKVQLKKIYLWKDWPGNWGRDKGIDLVAENHQGEIWAIQAKAYAENHYISKADVDTFLSESSRKDIQFRLLIAMTNNVGQNAQEVILAFIIAGKMLMNL